VVISRAGASTVTEIAAIGVASLLVPFPFAVDDHQTANAEFLASHEAAWICQQSALNAEWLAQWLSGLDRAQLSEMAQKAYALKNLEAVEVLCGVCQAQLGTASPDGSTHMEQST
jgi:UDP-N-acetylglucosamine--N-acetylmuramyl-(pentapeptide) pyrophosphoryl-undecaprenol N-acetylglucosamine transferase